jgi:ABC-type sugar transport system ATPase subunit
MNFLKAKVRADGSRIDFGPASVAPERETRAALTAHGGQEVEIGVRPEHWRVVSSEKDALPGRVAVREPLGNETLVHVDTAAGEIVVRLTHGELPAIEQQVGLVPDPAHLHVFDAASGASLLGESVAAAR